MKISTKTSYEIHSTSLFRKQLKKIRKQGKDLAKLEIVVEKLANGEDLEDCGECHIEPDWLLVY